jgi:Rhodanese-related sulfurtransferase
MYSFSNSMLRNRFIDCSEISKLINSKAQLIDIRNELEYKKEHIEGFINIPAMFIQYNLMKINIGSPVYLICGIGKQSVQVSQYLEQLGYDVYSFIGGMYNYKFVANSSYY